MAKPKRPAFDQSEIAPLNTNIFADTSAATPTAPDEPKTIGHVKKPKGEKVRAVSVALRDEEYRDFDQIAGQLQPLAATRMAVMNYALRRFLRDYKAGKVQVTTKAEDGRIVITD